MCLGISRYESSQEDEDCLCLGDDQKAIGPRRATHSIRESATYRQIVKLPRTSKRVFLHMEHPGDLAEVIVNGEFAAVLAWEPWAADITDLIKLGDNEIVIKVVNALANVLLMEPKPSGILGKVEIAIAKVVAEPSYKEIAIASARLIVPEYMAVTTIAPSIPSGSSALSSFRSSSR